MKIMTPTQGRGELAHKGGALLAHTLKFRKRQIKVSSWENRKKGAVVH